MYLLNSSSLAAPVTSVSSSFGTFTTKNITLYECDFVWAGVRQFAAFFKLTIRLNGRWTQAPVVLLTMDLSKCWYSSLHWRLHVMKGSYTYFLLQPGEIFAQSNCISYLQWKNCAELDWPWKKKVRLQYFCHLFWKNLSSLRHVGTTSHVNQTSTYAPCVM